jgi:FMN phosphatase YigB (HAD superfamily)
MVCFDLGGVLIKHCRTWREGCVAAGLPVRGECETPEAAARRKELAILFTTGRIEPGDFYRRMSDVSDGLYAPEEVERIHHAWLGPEYDDVGPVIRRLVEAGRVDTGVLSNTTHPHWVRQISENGVPAEFPTASMLRHRHASHLLGHMKPAPEIYGEFERRTGYRGSQILFLDDLPENARAAEALGWQVAPIDHTRETADQIAAVLERFGVV